MNKVTLVLFVIAVFSIIYRIIGVNVKDAVYYSVTTQTSMGPETNLVNTHQVNKETLKLVQTLQCLSLIFLIF